LTARNVLIFFILACTLSCTGKKDAKETQDIYTEKTQDVYSDWIISDDFRNKYQDGKEKEFYVDYSKKTVSQSVKECLSPYNLQPDDYLVNSWDRAEQLYKDWGKKYYLISDRNLILYRLQPAKIPLIEMDNGLSRIAFFADFRMLASDKYNLDDDPYIYLFVFDEKDGLIHGYDLTKIEYWCANDVFPIKGDRFEYFWIKDMPFKQLGDMSLIGDFNDDGYDEITLFNSDKEDPFGGLILFSIYGFTDETKSNIGNYKPIFEVPIRLFIGEKTWDFGPPVQFGTYKGIKGFIIYENVPTGETAKQYYGPESSGFDLIPVYKGIWNFYAWNKEEKKYAFIDSVNPDEIKTQWAMIKK